MEQERKKSGIGVIDALLTVVSLIFLIGILTFFRPCAAHEDGSFMACHWAGRAVMGVSALLLVISLVNLIIKNSGIKTGLLISTVFSAGLAALFPGILINLCMMDTMRCHTITRPATLVFSLITAVIAIIDIAVISIRKRVKETA